MRIGSARHRSRVPRWPVVALLGSAVWLGSGCSLLEPPDFPTAEPSPPEISVPEPSVPDRPGLEDAEKLRARERAERRRRQADDRASANAREVRPPDPTDDRIVLGQRRQGSLHCHKKRCNASYTLEVPRGGRLTLDLRAAGGEGLPDLSLLLEDARGRVVGASVRPQERPRVIRKNVAPGTYHVRIHALGSNGEIVSYDLLAELEKKRAKRRKRAEKKKSAAKPRVPQFHVVTSEVLEVERDGGEPAFVLIEAGKNAGIEVGLAGSLVENGKPIAKIEVVEVFPDGSRVRILDRLSAPITIATQAELKVPK